MRCGHERARRILLAGLAVLLVLSAAGCAPASAGTQKGQAAPDFSLPALGGGTVSLRDFRGRAVVLNFFATWCGPCRAEMPDMQALYAELQDRNLVVLGVNQAESEELVASFADAFALTFPIGLDSGREVGGLYGVRAYPTTVIIDGDGVIRRTIVGGPLSASVLRARVEGLLP